MVGDSVGGEKHMSLQRDATSAAMPYLLVIGGGLLLFWWLTRTNTYQQGAEWANSPIFTPPPGASDTATGLIPTPFQIFNPLGMWGYIRDAWGVLT